MSKNALVQLKNKLSKKEVKRLMADYYVKENSTSELLLEYHSKWIWLFFEEIDKDEINIQFSSDFSKKEKLDFLNELQNILEINIIEKNL